MLGATGFVGKVAAQAFLRRGFTVYGLTRTADKAKQLAQIESMCWLLFGLCVMV